MESLAILENREWYVCRTECSSPETILYGPNTFSNCVAYCTAFNKAGGRKVGHTFHCSQLDLVELAIFQRIEQYLADWAKQEVEEVA